MASVLIPYFLSEQKIKSTKTFLNYFFCIRYTPLAVCFKQLQENHKHNLPLIGEGCICTQTSCMLSFFQQDWMMQKSNIEGEWQRGIGTTFKCKLVSGFQIVITKVTFYD